MQDLSNLFQTILKLGMLALREHAILPRLVWQDFSKEEAVKGQLISVPVPRPGTVEDVNAGGDQTPDEEEMDMYTIAMNFWKQTSFGLSDKDLKEVEAGIFPMIASEKLKVLMNFVDNTIKDVMRDKCPYVVGSAGVVPDSIANIIAVRTQLQKNLAPNPRGMVVDSDTEGNFLNLGAFSNPQASGRLGGLLSGDMGHVFGFDMASDQNLNGNSITAGTHNGSEITAAAGAIGDTSISIDGGAGTAKKGETFQFAGHSQKYVLTADIGDTSAGTMNFLPHLKSAVGNNEAITFDYSASEVVNYHGVGFHPQFVGLVNRRMKEATPGLGVLSGYVTDPVTGLSIRLEVTRKNKKDFWTWDILFGTDIIRPEFGTWMRS